MNRIKSYITDLIYPFILIILLGILFSIIIYLFVDVFVGYDVFDEPILEKRLDGTLRIIGTAISITGFMSIIVAIIYSKRSIQRDIQKGTIELFQEFNGERFRKVRQEAWDIKEKWYRKKNYKKKFLECVYDDEKRKDNPEISREISLVYELLEFYLIASSLENHESILKSLRYFYYGWWRHFLYDVGEEIESLRGVHEDVIKNNKEYLENLSYVKNLERLDRLCGLQNLRKDISIHANGA